MEKLLTLIISLFFIACNLDAPEENTTTTFHTTGLEFSEIEIAEDAALAWNNALGYDAVVISDIRPIPGDSSISMVDRFDASGRTISYEDGHSEILINSILREWSDWESGRMYLIILHEIGHHLRNHCGSNGHLDVGNVMNNSVGELGDVLGGMAWLPTDTDVAFVTCKLDPKED